MLSRAGHAQMCKALDMPALMATTNNPAVKAFGDRILAGRMAPKAVIWACMHQLAMLIFGVLRSGLPFDRRTVAVSHIADVAA